ncbi:MAG: hypothetical protein VKL59_14910 [Nostocaceae cyanobacterium]|nr:hypothetical protein [Nostocaceae cyanobacterium]
MLQRDGSCATWGDPKTALHREPPSGFTSRLGRDVPSCSAGSPQATGSTWREIYQNIIVNQPHA